MAHQFHPVVKLGVIEGKGIVVVDHKAMGLDRQWSSGVNFPGFSDFASTALIHDKVWGHIIVAAVADTVDIDVIVNVVGVVIVIVIVPGPVDNNVFQTDVPVANSACFSAILEDC
jgi:hypothetical protein